MTPLLELKTVWKIFPHPAEDVIALREIDFSLYHGDFIALMGPSGSGKSTLMHLMGCLDRPTLGDVLVEGESIGQASDEILSELRARKIGFIFQSFHLIPQLTVLENVALPLQYRCPGTQKQALESLERVGLMHRKDHVPSQLSGGERQRVAIARALMGDPAVIFADEPTGNLDTGTGDAVMKLLAELNGASKTIVLVTHDHAVASKCRTIMTLKDGKLCA